MKILVIGSGGREHAIAWHLAQSGHTVIGAPGNPGTEEVGTRVDSSDYLRVATEFNVDLTVVGPEAPLVAGAVDAFQAAGLAIVGPTQQNARLEGSKIHAKAFMDAAGIPTARSFKATSREEAIRALCAFSFPVVVKADGLAVGKGVVIARDRGEAERAIASLGENLLLEEFLEGEEVSYIVLSDGRDYVAMDATQDHKRVWDNDEGPNTGGMGAYCDGRILDRAEADLIERSVIQPVISRTGFTGFLYAGIMMTSDGPKVLEFNVRLGDPETQPMMQRLAGTTLAWRSDPSVCVVMAAEGYPGNPKTGDQINGVSTCPGLVFQAGTRRTEAGLVTSGGRVLGVVSSGPDLAAAIRRTYDAVAAIQFRGMHFRSDIGRKGLKRW